MKHRKVVPANVRIAITSSVMEKTRISHTKTQVIPKKVRKKNLKSLWKKTENEGKK